MRIIFRLFVFSCLIYIALSCKKKESNEAPSINIHSPVENTTINSIDTLDVKVVVTDDDANNLRVSLYVADENMQSVTAPTVYNFSGNYVNLDVKYAVDERWLESGTYYFVVNASDGELQTKSFVKISVSSIPKVFSGLVVGVKSSQGCDIYMCDTNFVFTKQFSVSNCLGGAYNCFANYLNVVLSNGSMEAYNFPYYNQVFSISGLNKVGSPFKADIAWIYPYVYVTNANGSIFAVDDNGQVRTAYRTIFSPYKMIRWNNKWVNLSDYYPQNNTWVEVPDLSKNYQFNGTLTDLAPLDNERCLIIQQDMNTVKLYTYKPEINYLSSFGHDQTGTYNGYIKSGSSFLISIDNQLYELNEIYGTLYSVYTGESLTELKWEDRSQLIYGVNQNRIITLKNSPVQVLSSYDFPDKVVFYDFIYN